MRAAVALSVLLLLLLGVLIVALRDLRRIHRAYRLVHAGDYAAARIENERLTRSWLALVPSVRNATRYGIALTEHMDGNLEDALATLSRIDRAKVPYAAASLEASTLVLVDRDLARAKELLEGIDRSQRQPEDLLFLAHACHGEGDAARAEELLRAAGPSRAGGGPTYESVFHTTRGLLLVKLGRPDEALADFERAAEVPLSNWYTRRARALLPRAADDDPRSSLAPQIIEE